MGVIWAAWPLILTWTALCLMPVRKKTLTASLLYRRPWRLFVGLPAWLIRFLIGLIRRQSVYDAARNRGHFTLAKWDILSTYSQRLVNEKLQHRVPREAKERLIGTGLKVIVWFW